MFDEHGVYIDTVTVEGFLDFYSSFNSFVSSFSEQYEEMKEINTALSDQNNIIITELSELSQIQGNTMVLNMLLCGLLGLIIGICFVNIFKSR